MFDLGPRTRIFAAFVSFAISHSAFAESIQSSHTNKNYILVSQASMTPTIGAAGDSQQPTTNAPVTETSQGEAHDRPWLIRPLVMVPLTILYFGTPDISSVAYMPNFSILAGVRASWKSLGLVAAIALPQPRSELDRRGETRQVSFVLSSFQKTWAMDLYYQRYHGLYVNRLVGEFDLNKADRYPKLPNAQIENIGFNFHYNLSPERLDLKAAFDQIGVQENEGGSWIISPFYNRLIFSMGDQFIPASGGGFPDRIPDADEGTFDTLGATVGYAYLYPWHDFYFAIHAAAGPGLQRASIERNATASDLWRIAGKINGTLAIAYNKDDFQYGIRILADSLSSNNGGTYMASTLINGMAFAGWRF
jgi:hypothetical protein